MFVELYGFIGLYEENGIEFGDSEGWVRFIIDWF